MSLITPLFLVGLLGLALPWWLHRLETQTTEREKFSTTRFLEASKKRIHVQRKLKYLLLMALRMLFLALLAFAFARPIFLSDPEVAVSEDTTHHIIVMDTSFSMREGDNLAQARSMATSIINNMGADDIASIYSASTGVKTIAEPTADAAELNQLLTTVEADNGRLDLGAMISSLNGLIEESEANFIMHVVGDFQQSGQAVRFADMVPDVINGRPVTLDVQQVDTNVHANWAVDSVIVENRSTVIASIRTFNAAAEPVQKDISLMVNGEAQQQQTLTTTGNGVFLAQFDNVVFAEGDNRVNVSLAPQDTLAEDDVRYTVFDNSPPAPVLLLTSDPASLGVTYIKAALETAPRGYQVEAVNIADLDMRIMQRYPWLIVEDIGTVGTGLEASLRDYINGGGAVFAGAGPRSTSLTALPILGNAIDAVAASTRTAVQQITQIDTTHPALNDSSGWSSVNVRAVPFALSPEDRVLVAQSARSPVLIERNIGAGRIMLFASSLDNSNSDLPVKPVFVSFISEVAQYLSNEKLLVKEQVADSFLQLTLTGGSSGQVIDPDGTSLLSLEDTTRDQDVQLNKTGYYQVFTPAGEVLVAVNPDIRESDLTLMPVQTLQTWQNVVAGTATAEPSTSLSTTTEVSDQDEVEIWRFFLILLAIMVLAESLLGNRYLNMKTGSF
ncbi:MAG: BatA and WFA domain-containing protein [Pseudomonadota bacterium]